MKIALYSQYFVSKFEYMENGFSREFQRLGHDVIIVTGVKRYPKLYSEALEIKLGQNKISPGEYDENGIKIVRLEMRETGLQGNIGIPKRFISNLKKYSIDIIFFQSLELYQAAVLAVITKYYLRCKLYMVVNEHYVHKNTSGNPKINSRFKYFKKFFKKLIKRAILKLSDRVIGMNEYSSMVAKKICPSVESKLVEVTLAVDHYNIYFKPDFRIIIRKKYGISDDNIVIIHTGKLLPFKKTDVLVQAVGIINDPKIRIMLVGHGPENYLNKIKKIAISYGIDNKILFIPFVDSKKVHHYYSAADIAVWPDILTISTIEASAVGIPVIVPNYHGYEHRTKYNNGLRIRPGDVKDLVEKLKYLIANDSRRKLMGEKGRDLVERELNWEKIVSKILA